MQSSNKKQFIDEQSQTEGNRWICLLLSILICCVILPISINSNSSSKNKLIHKHYHNKPTSQPTSFPSNQPTFLSTNSSVYIIQNFIDFILNNNSYLRHN